MNSGYESFGYSTEVEEKDWMDNEKFNNKSKKIVTGLEQLDSEEIELLIELVDAGIREFTIDPEELELKDILCESKLQNSIKANLFLLINSLTNKKYLVKSRRESNVACPNCHSSIAKIIFSCPNCASSKLSKKEILEHRYCGYSNEKSFFNKENLVCPKCKSDLLNKVSINEVNQQNSSACYNIKSVFFTCNECENEMSTPIIDYSCVDCGNKYNYVDALYQVSIKYLIPDTIYNKILSRNKLNLLIVEDYTPQADVVAMLLSDADNHIEYNIAIADNGSSAILALQENEFDVVLLDLGLPDMNGLDLLVDLKTRWPDMQVIVLTGYDDIEIAVEAMKKGASEFLIKKDDVVQNLPEIMKKIFKNILK